MNYRSQMNAHALDRAHEFIKITEQADANPEMVVKIAKQYAKFCYVPSEDIRDTWRYVLDLFNQNLEDPNGEDLTDLLDETIRALGVVQEQHQRKTSSLKVVKQ